jgi:hypothetical protein
MSIPTKQHPKLKLNTKSGNVYSTLHQASPTIAYKLLVLETMHSRGVLCAVRFPGQLLPLKSPPPSTPFQNHRVVQRDVNTITATANPLEASFRRQEHGYEDDHDCEFGGSITLSSEESSDSDLDVLTPRNLEHQFSSIELEDQSFDSEGAKAE